MDRYYNIFAIDDLGKIYTWGENTDGELGNGTTENSNLPVCISELENSALKGKKIDEIYYIFFDGLHIIARDKDEKIYTWGTNNGISLGSGIPEQNNIPISISDNSNNELYNKKIKDIIDFYDSWEDEDFGYYVNMNIYICQDGKVMYFYQRASYVPQPA